MELSQSLVSAEEENDISSSTIIDRALQNYISHIWCKPICSHITWIHGYFLGAVFFLESV